MAAAHRRTAAAAATPARMRLCGLHRGDRPAAPRPVRQPPRSPWSSSWPTRRIVCPPSSLGTWHLDGRGGGLRPVLSGGAAGAYTLLGLPINQLSGQIVDLVDVLGPAGRRLAEQLRETPSWRRRFALLDEFLLGRLERGPRPAPEVGWAWERLMATGGAVPIGRIAAEVGWSHKHLIARFSQQVGLRPGTPDPGLPPVHRDHPDAVFQMYYLSGSSAQTISVARLLLSRRPWQGGTDMSQAVAQTGVRWRWGPGPARASCWSTSPPPGPGSASTS